MTPRIQQLPAKKLIGKRLIMSFSNNKTAELWRSFMPQRKDIKNALTPDLISLQIYPSSFDFKIFNPEILFEKWAAVEVSDFGFIPKEMEPYTLPGGLYAIFIHKGAASTAQKTFQYIFGNWLPDSDYLLDQRPHFEILGAKYKNDDPASEEEVWVPIKPKE